jgi:succinyl-diaminopimelate desuccinylase
MRPWSASRPILTEMGDMIKIGRRGSLSGTLTGRRRAGPCRLSASGRQSAARMVMLADALLDPPLDAGNERFPPSNLEITRSTPAIRRPM